MSLKTFDEFQVQSGFKLLNYDKTKFIKISPFFSESHLEEILLDWFDPISFSEKQVNGVDRNEMMLKALRTQRDSVNSSIQISKLAESRMLVITDLFATIYDHEGAGETVSQVRHTLVNWGHQRDIRNLCDYLYLGGMDYFFTIEDVINFIRLKNRKNGQGQEIESIKSYSLSGILSRCQEKNLRFSINPKQKIEFLELQDKHLYTKIHGTAGNVLGLEFDRENLELTRAGCLRSDQYFKDQSINSFHQISGMLFFVTQRLRYYDCSLNSYCYYLVLASHNLSSVKVCPQALEDYKSAVYCVDNTKVILRSRKNHFVCYKIDSEEKRLFLWKRIEFVGKGTLEEISVVPISMGFDFFLRILSANSKGRNETEKKWLKISFDQDLKI